MPQLANERTAQVAEKETVDAAMLAFKRAVRQKRIIKAKKALGLDVSEDEAALAATEEGTSEEAVATDEAAATTNEDGSPAPAASASIPGDNGFAMTIESGSADETLGDDLLEDDPNEFAPVYDAGKSPFVELRISRVTMGGDIHLLFSEDVHVPPFIKANLN